MYFNYRLVENQVRPLSELDGFDPIHDILLLITGKNTEVANTRLTHFFKETLDDIKVSEVKFMNCSDRLDDISEFNLDLDNFEWP